MGQSQIGEFQSLVEAVRAGTIFAHDRKSYASWRSSVSRKGVGLTGESLERVVMGLAVTHPDLVSIRP